MMSFFLEEPVGATVAVAAMPEKKRESVEHIETAEDTALAEKLKEELNFNLQRRKGFSKHIEDQKIYHREREKGFALFLEENEKFEIERERGLALHKKTKTKPMDESSPEYFADLKDKKNRDRWLEEARSLHVKTRDQIVSQYNQNTQTHSEAEELDLLNSRPRYDLRKRYKNKWIKGSSTGLGSHGAGSFNGGAPSPEGPSMDFPAPVEYAPPYAPPPMDNFEEIPPPPPMIPYDQNQGYESGFGEAPMPPPPPPPPDGGWDF